MKNIKLLDGGDRKELSSLIDPQQPAGACPGRQVSPGVFG